MHQNATKWAPSEAKNHKFLRVGRECPLPAPTGRVGRGYPTSSAPRSERLWRSASPNPVPLPAQSSCPSVSFRLATSLVQWKTVPHIYSCNAVARSVTPKNHSTELRSSRAFSESGNKHVDIKQWHDSGICGITATKLELIGIGITGVVCFVLRDDSRSGGISVTAYYRGKMGQTLDANAM